MCPVPSDAELSVYYAAYTTEETVSLPKSGPGSDHPTIRRWFHFLSGDVDPRDFVVIPENARVLDYGSGQGTYLQYFHAQGVDVWGAEVTDTLVDACRHEGLRVNKVTSFEEIPFADNEFDVVYLMQVFEHLRDPRKFMLELSRIIKQGGNLYIAVPNAASIWRRVFGLNWVSGWFAPFHLFHYTKPALDRLAREFGFSAIDSWSRTPDSWFRLNLKARLFPTDNHLDSRNSWLDRAPLRHVLIILLRLCEIVSQNRDCLVMKFERR